MADIQAQLRNVLDNCRDQAIAALTATATQEEKRMREIATDIAAGLATDGKLPAIRIYENGGAIRVLTGQLRGDELCMILPHNLQLPPGRSGSVDFPELQLSESRRVRITVIVEPVD